MSFLRFRNFFPLVLILTASNAFSEVPSHCEKALLTAEQESQIKKLLDQNLENPEFQSALYRFVYQVVLNSKIYSQVHKKSELTPEVVSSFIRFMDLPVLHSTKEKILSVSKKSEFAGIFISEIKKIQREILDAEDQEKLSEYFISKSLEDPSDRESFLYWVRFFGMDQSTVTAALLIDDFVTSHSIQSKAKQILKILESDTKLAATELLEAHERLKDQKFYVEVQKSFLDAELVHKKLSDSESLVLHEQYLALNSMGLDDVTFQAMVQKVKDLQKWDQISRRNQTVKGKWINGLKRVGAVVGTGLAGYLLTPNEAAPIIGAVAGLFSIVPFEVFIRFHDHEQLFKAIDSVSNIDITKTIHQMNLKQLAEYKDQLTSCPRYHHYRESGKVYSWPNDKIPAGGMYCELYGPIVERQNHLREIKDKLIGSTKN